MREEFKSEKAATPPRFQIVDLLAIVAAFALAFGLVSVLFDSGQGHFGPLPPGGRRPPVRTPKSADVVVLESIFAVGIGIVFVHPAMIGTEYFTRRRLRLIDMRTSVGMFPAFAVAIVSTLGSRPLRSSPLFIIAYMSIGSAVLSFLLLAADSPKSAWRWTDWYGCAVAIVYGMAVPFIMTIF